MAIEKISSSPISPPAYQQLDMIKAINHLPPVPKGLAAIPDSMSSAKTEKKISFPLTPSSPISPLHQQITKAKTSFTIKGGLSAIPDSISSARAKGSFPTNNYAPQAILLRAIAREEAHFSKMISLRNQQIDIHLKQRNTFEEKELSHTKKLADEQQKSSILSAIAAPLSYLSHAMSIVYGTSLIVGGVGSSLPSGGISLAAVIPGGVMVFSGGVGLTHQIAKDTKIENMIFDHLPFLSEDKKNIAQNVFDISIPIITISGSIVGACFGNPASSVEALDVIKSGLQFVSSPLSAISHYSQGAIHQTTTQIKQLENQREKSQRSLDQLSNNLSEGMQRHSSHLTSFSRMKKQEDETIEEILTRK